MDFQTKLLNIFNKIFWIIVVIIFINEAYNLLEPKIIGIFKDKNMVTDSDIINELSDCTTTYFDSINFKQYDKSNMLNAYLNRKSYKEYDTIYNKINNDSEYKLIVKYAYRLMNETYRCYVLVQDLSTNNQQFISNDDKNSMHEIIVKLNVKNSTFKILYDKFK
ncbi:MAG: hypothetical protein PHD15_01165 [Clostridia bacterium]|nr:hypothetical protein [Clostridia bacterium]MDD4386359.1 hypothetical protein [Clostridia bacterium]